MAVESWMDFPILITVVIITRSKVDDIVEARQKHRWIQIEQEQKVVKQLTEKVSKLETQPFQTQGFMTSSSQNISNPFGNLSTSFQVKADLDIGKFSGTEPAPSDKLNFNQWCIDVKSYQSSYPDNILLPAV